MDATVARSEARLLTHREARAIVLGVLLPVFMGSLDSTILASALPSIGRELGNVHALPWLITAYLIASTVRYAAVRQDQRHSRAAPHARLRDRGSTWRARSRARLRPTC